MSSSYRRQAPRRTRSGKPLRGARGGRATAAALAAVATSLNAAACYTYHPMVSSAPQPGQYVSLELTDQGRVDVSGRMGPGVLRVRGLLQGTDGDAYIVGVQSVALVDGQVSHWTGERVSIPRGDVGATQERVFSRSRTLLAAGSALAAIGVFIATRSLIGGGVGSGDRTKTGGTGSQ